VSNSRSHLPSSYLACHTPRMKTPLPTNLYKRHRFPAEIISHGVRLYCRFCLSYRGVEELMAARGIIPT
jgi:transposase-like protein